MKKLFFLCAFLLMSMQMQAQLYIVSYSTWDIEYDVNGNKIFDDYGVLMEHTIIETVYAPDGSMSRKVIFHGTKAEYKKEPRTIILQTISSTLNNIISKGYTLLETEDLGGNTLFYGPKQNKKTDALGTFAEPVFYLVKK